MKVFLSNLTKAMTDSSVVVIKSNGETINQGDRYSELFDSGEWISFNINKAGGSSFSITPIFNKFLVKVNELDNVIQFRSMLYIEGDDQVRIGSRYLRGDQPGNNYIYRQGGYYQGELDSTTSDDNIDNYTVSFDLVTRGRAWVEIFSFIDGFEINCIENIVNNDYKKTLLEYVGYKFEEKESPVIASFKINGTLEEVVKKITLLFLIVESCMYVYDLYTARKNIDLPLNELSFTNENTENSVSEYELFKFYCESKQSKPNSKKFNLDSFDKDNVVSALTGLLMGKHIIFSGPAGSGKSTLAKMIASYWLNTKIIKSADTDYPPIMCTASPAWTYGDLVARYIPRSDGHGLEVDEGFLLTALSERKPLIIDEINRANIEACFGELYTLMAGQSVTLPFKKMSAKGKLENIEINYDEELTDSINYSFFKNFRIFGTMNDKDRTILHDLSFAMLRRFFVISIRHKESVGDLAELVNNEVCGVNTLNEMDLFVKEYIKSSGASEAKARQLALTHFIIPMIDAVDILREDILIKIIKSMIRYVENGKGFIDNDIKLLKNDLRYKYKDSYLPESIKKIIFDN